MVDWIYEREAQDVNGQIRLSMFVPTIQEQERIVSMGIEHLSIIT